MKRVAWSVAGLLALLVAYLLAWPIDFDPAVWSAPQAPGYVGPHAVNQRLAGLAQLPIGDGIGPEHVVVREEGGQPWLWMALAGAGPNDRTKGRIVRMKPDGSAREVVVETGGRPLGFDFDAEGALIVADPQVGRHGGLLRVTGRGAEAKVTVLADQVDGDPIRYADAVIVAGDGTIYFSDASRRFSPAVHGSFDASVIDILEHRCTGRILAYEPPTRRTRVLFSGLCFPNGVALSGDGQHLFVAETGAYRIWKVAVAAQGVDARQALAQPGGAARVLLDNLPGFPDNIMRGASGRLWTGLTKPRSAFTDDNAARPWMRSLAMRLPRALWPVPPAYGHVFAFDEEGRIVADLQDPKGSYPETTAVTEHGDRLYIQSLHARTLGVLERRAAGL